MEIFSPFRLEIRPDDAAGFLATIPNQLACCCHSQSFSVFNFYENFNFSVINSVCWTAIIKVVFDIGGRVGGWDGITAGIFDCH